MNLENLSVAFIVAITAFITSLGINVISPNASNSAKRIVLAIIVFLVAIPATIIIKT